MVGGLKAGLLRPVLVGGMTRQDGGDVEDDGCLLVGERVLGRGFMGEGVVPDTVAVSRCLSRSRIISYQVKEILM